MTFYKQTFDDSEVDFRHDEDQYSTDFDKAIDVVRDHEATYNVSHPLMELIIGGTPALDRCFGWSCWTC